MTLLRIRFLPAAAMLLILPATGWATNGYFSHGTSVAEKGLAGAGVAYSQDTLAAANNPAGMVWQGAGYDIGAAAFSPIREYSSEGGPALPAGTPCGPCPFSIGDGDQSIDSENELFLIPQFGYNWELNDTSTIGLSVFGNGGLNTEYKGGIAIAGPPTGPANAELPGTFGDGTAGVDLAQLFVSTTYAAQISDVTSLGISGIIAYQRFEAKGLGNFGAFSLDPDNLTNNSHETSTGLGVRLGLQTELMPGVRFGVAYQPEIDMDEFDDYSGLFAEDGDFDIPSNYTIGVAIDVGQSGILVVDVQQINYEDVKAVSNPIENLFTDCGPGGTDGCLGGDDGAGFGWEDMTIVKIGYQWQHEEWTWRVGYSQSDQPIPSSEVVFNILAPGVMEQHVTFGFTRQLDKDSSISFAAMYAPTSDVDGENTFEPSPPFDPQDIELEMTQYELALTYSRRM